MVSDLNDYYRRVYASGKSAHFLKYRHGRALAEEHVGALAWIEDSYRGTADTILDFGCGEADFLKALPRFSRRIVIDASEAALTNARADSSGLELRLGTDGMLSDLTSCRHVSGHSHWRN